MWARVTAGQVRRAAVAASGVAACKLRFSCAQRMSYVPILCEWNCAAVFYSV